ncbi:MAG: FtsX-like permease family protein [Bryobacteraceae bacterium]|nr:FtsX-like permease family protein [Bryobacteraceae bacterium]
MTGNFRWRTAAKIAWRESRASAVKFGFVVLAVAVGVGSLTGVRGFSTAFHAMLLREARTLMAADLSARMFRMPDAAQLAVIEDLKKQGVRETQITETLTMVSSPKTQTPVLVSAKAIDPAVYPFYGEVEFDPPAALATALTPEVVGLSADLMMRLNVAPGDSIRLGGMDYRVLGMVSKEPDKMAGSLNIGPRLLMSRDGLARTALLNEGSRAAQRFLFKLPPAGTSGAPGVEDVRQRLKKAFPDAMVIDFRETNPIITRGLNRSTMFLSLISLIALIVGSIGVATAIRSHLEQKLDSIAVMKCLGARSGQIVRIYIIQTLALGLAGGVLGALLGGVVQLAFPFLISRYFPVPPSFAWDGASLAQGLITALLATLLFTLPPLLAIRDIRPSLILRREMSDGPRRRNWRSAVTAGAILIGLGALAAWIAGGKPMDALQLGGYFAGGIAVALISLGAVAWLLLRSMKYVVRTRALPSSLRHGFANLYRPGNQAQAVLVALGLGVMFTVTIYLVQRSMLQEMAASAPPGMPNVFLLDIQPSQRDEVAAILDRQKNLAQKPEIVPSVAVRMTHVNGKRVEELDLKGFSRRFLQTRNVTWSEAKPPQTTVTAGAWWSSNAAGQVSIGEDAARILQLTPGATLDFTAAGQSIQARVAAVHRSDAIRMGATADFIFSPKTLETLPAIFYGGLRMPPTEVPALQRTLYERFPTVTVVNIADVINTVQDVVDQIALVVRFVSAFAIMAGVVILASSVAGTRFRRIREVVILKTLGATRARISRIFSAEFLVLGATAGLMGSLLAMAFSNLVLIQFFEGQWKFDWLPLATSVALTALLANAAGWIASARILGQKPLEVLRAE